MELDYEMKPFVLISFLLSVPSPMQTHCTLDFDLLYYVPRLPLAPGTIATNFSFISDHKSPWMIFFFNDWHVDEYRDEDEHK